MDAPSGSWPLSAAATALLQDTKTSADEVLKLTLKELVLRRVWRVERGVRGARRRKPVPILVRGDRPVPPLAPLPSAHEALRAVVTAGGSPVGAAVNQALSIERDLARRLRDEALDELAALGLVVVERRKVLALFARTAVTPTPSGDAWVMDAGGRESALRTALGRTGRELAPQMATMGGLMLLLDPNLRADVQDSVRRLRDDHVVAGTSGVTVEGPDFTDDELELDAGELGDVGALDFSDLGALDGLDTGFDSAFDAGVSGGDGGGGDGGGGDGGSS